METELVQKKRGQPTKFGDVKEAILTRVRAGSSPGLAALGAGISRTTLWNWRQKAKKDPDGEMAQWLQELDSAFARAKAYGEESIYSAGANKARPVSCGHCNITYETLPCETCGDDVELRCTEEGCGRELKFWAPSDWKAMAHWMKAQMRQKWGNHLNVDTDTQLRAAMQALSEEFTDEPEIFGRIVDVLTRGQHVGEMTG